MASVTRLCGTKSIVTVNGQFPGPTLFAREGDRVEVAVVNRSPYNVSLHWHGVRQLLSGWADGPAYITQCPIPPGGRYVYRYRIAGQRGTLWWHAHVSWLRATLYGPIIILPPAGAPHWRAGVDRLRRRAPCRGGASRGRARGAHPSP